MKDEDTILLLVAAAVLFFLWKRNQQAHATGASTALGAPSPAGPPPALAPSGGLSGSALAAAKASGTPFRAPTANGTAGGVPFGQTAVDRSKPRPTSPSATSKALNNSTLSKAENYSIAGGVAAAKAFGIPPALSRPIAKYGNPVALGRDVVVGGKAVGGAVVSAGKAVGNFFGGLF
jgi:hypothetical protein